MDCVMRGDQLQRSEIRVDSSLSLALSLLVVWQFAASSHRRARCGDFWEQIAIFKAETCMQAASFAHNHPYSHSRSLALLSRTSLCYPSTLDFVIWKLELSAVATVPN